MKAKLIKTDEGFFLCIPHETTNEFIASIDGMYMEHKLSLKNCQSIERGYDLDELLKKEIADGKLHPNDGAKKEGIARGIELALEILGDKKFSEDDIKFAWAEGELGIHSHNHVLNSLQQTEWDVIVEMEEYEPLYGEGSTSRLKLDADGCLILKLKL